MVSISFYCIPYLAVLIFNWEKKEGRNRIILSNVDLTAALKFAQDEARGREETGANTPGSGYSGQIN